jgi:hypothetical protein
LLPAQSYLPYPLLDFATNIWCSYLHQHVGLHDVIHLFCYHTFLKISAWHPEVWQCGRSCTSAKNLRSMRTASQHTEQIHFWIVRSARDDMMNLSKCTGASSTSTDELLYTIMRMPNMYTASSWPLYAAWSMFWSLSALEPNS